MILLVNGPNLNLLGEREPEVYGHETLADVERVVADTCAAYGVEVKPFQSNWEGAILDFLQEHRQIARGVILNPGAFTHTSRALHDCLKALPCPVIEVHISNIHLREPWRRRSVTAPATQGQIVGLGISGYYYAALHLCSMIAAAQAEAGLAAEVEAGFGGQEEAGLAAQVAGTSGSLGARSGALAIAGSGEEMGEQPPEEPAELPGEHIPVDVHARGDYEPL
jgi:3-dehydroquinate dehydratase II